MPSSNQATVLNAMQPPAGKAPHPKKGAPSLACQAGRVCIFVPMQGCTYAHIWWL